VADEHHRDSTLLEPPHNSEEPIDLGVRKGCGGFVHDEHLGVTDQCATDRDQLAVCHRKGLDVRVQIHL